ncbi:protein FAR1-RELATED SEQUENCE 5-like [Chenopodium quinoa]|uniref:protein FAR1-RELATED SEQUENCE 5-like n=1 Tax=Chenopodium quinoa TaxID=63459 RepID=UPI000B78C5AB|nr:protein FAR1-RELATED SEQUENCE 5-like [Chenopodium quinoa]
MVDDNSNFFHTYHVDELGRLQDVLWVDARSRVAYEEFGDVVVFDSTYLTNEYKLPFCNFVGVNHHGQTILFGCALLSRETSETFVWVFSNWLRCMGEKKPIGILTDQDPAMKKALKLTMKESTHRWCIWHITQKFGKKLGKLPNYPALHDDLENAIYDSLDCEEFESNWQTVIKKHEIEDDEWLTGLFLFIVYVLVSLFCSVCVLGCVCFVGVSNVEDLLISTRSTSEKRADDNNERYVRQAYSDFPAELVFQMVYIDAKFKEVQRECSRVMYVSEIHRNKLSDNVTEHIVEDRVWYKPKNCRKEKPSKMKREYKLLYDSSSKEVSCECRMFDCAGIICRHMIKVYERINFFEIPDKYILRR